MLIVGRLKFTSQLIHLSNISLWTWSPPSLPSLKSISSLLSKHSTMTTFVVLWLSVQCSLYKLSLSFTKSVEISYFASSLLFTPSSQYLCTSQYFGRSRLGPHHPLTGFIQEKPRGYSQLLWWASWQALEVATKIFREIVIVKRNSRQRPEF